jgi:dihydrofolate synthase/folylpolyglutamate synthase
MQYEDAIQYYAGRGKFSHAPGLETMRELCRLLGDPQDALRFVHIAGTNGKGSCAALTASILRASGRRTGLYTSPDLTDIRERIDVDGVDITPTAFVRLTERVAQAADRMQAPSFFELLTALGFLYFAQEQCGYVALECGLGGRYDATNVIKTPDCAVIMSIGMDHTAILGDTLAKIAAEKAGIIKPGGTVVSAPQEPEALRVIEETCAERGASLHVVDISDLHPVSASLDGQVFSYKNLKDLRIGLLGAHQMRNACAAVEAAWALGIGEDAVRAGLAGARWPCRFELLRREPPFVIDGAHNPHGAAALTAALAQVFPEQKFVFLMGVMADKDYGSILRRMEPLAERFICCTPDSPRALPAQALAEQVRGVPAEAVDNLEDAVAKCLNTGLPVCAFGSLYYVGYVRKMLLP